MLIVLHKIHSEQIFTDQVEACGPSEEKQP